ncbi:MAG: hypothetical protein GX347_00990 [Epulopiscium sp.]|nr:hypothetical protein [Candidatus Epulonipiscium sp.]
MDKTIVAVFSTRDEAENAAHEIKNRGLRMDDISIIAKADDGALEEGPDSDDFVNDNISDGVTTGGVLGGLAGLLLGAGTFALPGLGVIAAAGPLAGVLSGAVTGGIVGGLVDLGIPEDDSKQYENYIKQGKYVFTMQQSDDKVDEVANVLRNYGASEVNVY